MQDKLEIAKEKIINAAQALRIIPKERIIIGTFFVLLISFLFYQLIVVTQFRRLKAIDFQFNSQQQLLDAYNQLLMQKDNFIEEKRAKEVAFAQIKESFVSEEELSSYFDKFRAIVKSGNLEIVSLDFKPQENPGDFNGRQFSHFQILPLSVSVRGGYFSIMSLLYKLEQGKSLFDIRSIHISGGSPETEGIVMDIQASIYIFKKI